jgi:hypothetical protein
MKADSCDERQTHKDHPPECALVLPLQDGDIEKATATSPNAGSLNPFQQIRIQ